MILSKTVAFRVGLFPFSKHSTFNSVTRNGLSLYRKHLLDLNYDNSFYGFQTSPIYSPRITGPVQVNLVAAWLNGQDQYESSTVVCHFWFITDYERDIFMRCKNDRFQNFFK